MTRPHIVLLAMALIVSAGLTAAVWLHPSPCPYGLAVSHTIPAHGCAPSPVRDPSHW